MNRKYPNQRSQQDTASPNPIPGPDPEQQTMSSWFERQASNHRVQLAAVAILSGITVAGAIYSTQAIRRKEAVDELKASIPELSEDHKADLVRPQEANAMARLHPADCLSEAQ